MLTKREKGSILIKLTHEREVRTKKREERARGFKANTWTVAVRLKANLELGKKFQRKFSKRISKKYLTNPRESDIIKKFHSKRLAGAKKEIKNISKKYLTNQNVYDIIDKRSAENEKDKNLKVQIFRNLEN